MLITEPVFKNADVGVNIYAEIKQCVNSHAVFSEPDSLNVSGFVFDICVEPERYPEASGTSVRAKPCSVEGTVRKWDLAKQRGFLKV